MSADWTAIGETGAIHTAPFPIPGWSSRTTLLRLRSGAIAALNPAPEIAEAEWKEISRFGPVEFLLAPNHFHHLGIPAWKQRHPRARIVAAAGACERLEQKLGVEVEPLYSLQANLPPDCDLWVPAGLNSGEVWLCRRGRETLWVVGDAFFNLSRTPRSWAGLLLRLSGTTPGLRIGQTFRRACIEDRRSYRGWVLRQLDEAPPTRLIPAHGAVLESESLPERLRSLIELRIGPG